MRKLFFIVCCILALDICLADDWWKNNFIIGAHWGPPLHHKYNNVDSPLVRNFTLLKDGGFNFIVGKMNLHNYKASAFLTSHLESLSKECKDSGLFFLNEANDPDTIYYGIDIADEPSKEKASSLLEIVDALKQDNPDRLGFINLLPTYGFDSISKFKTYANTYLGDTTLQVACFDNYYPHSLFTTHHPSASGNYYFNIAYMKQLAGSRPLWAYLRSSEKFLEEKDSTWQDAYIRLGAFAPLAFGSKGIIYFSYDCKDRNMILRSPGRGGWRSLYFDNDEKSRQIFFGNFKYSTTSTFPDLAIHTNDSLGTWRIKETNDSGTEQDMKMITIGTWYGDHILNMPNIYNWDFNPDGHDKFTTLTRFGELLLSMFRNGWIRKAIIDNFPTHYWSTMSRYICPFGDFNGNQELDLCLGWTENGQGKLRICMDCHDIPTTPQGANMDFANSSQIFTFHDPIIQTIARNDSICVITSNPNSSYINSDSLHILKYSGNQFSVLNTYKVTLQKKMDHYWMEDSLYAQDNNGNVWGEAPGQIYSLTKLITNFSSSTIYVWGQYNNRTNKYDRYGIAPDERYGFQAYALLNRKGNPNRIYQTAKTVNHFINDSISQIIRDKTWQGAYFTSEPNQKTLDSLKIIKGSNPNPFPLIRTDYTLSDCVLFGLFRQDYDNMDLLVINMQESSEDVKFSFNHDYSSRSYRCNKITRMYPDVISQLDDHTCHTNVTLYNMLGGECAILHFIKTSN